MPEDADKLFLYEKFAPFGAIHSVKVCAYISLHASVYVCQTVPVHGRITLFTGAREFLCRCVMLVSMCGHVCGARVNVWACACAHLHVPEVVLIDARCREYKEIPKKGAQHRVQARFGVLSA